MLEWKILNISIKFSHQIYEPDQLLRKERVFRDRGQALYYELIPILAKGFISLKQLTYMWSRKLLAAWELLWERLHNIQFLTGGHEVKKIKAGFFKIAQFPNVVGIIDDTQILIQDTSTDDKHLYVCRKGIDAINVQDIVDHDLRFVYIL